MTQGNVLEAMFQEARDMAMYGDSNEDGCSLTKSNISVPIHSAR
jgi:hypothetical protein